jgi:hypothetical protein
MVEIGKANRAIQAEHALASTPLGNSIQQGLEDIVIVNKIEPAETTLLNAPSLISAMVYNAYDTTYNLVVTVGHIYHKVTNLECGVTLGVEGIHLIEEYRWAIVRVTLVQVYSKLHKSFNVAFCCHLSNENGVGVSSRHKSYISISLGSLPSTLKDG